MNYYINDSYIQIFFLNTFRASIPLPIHFFETNVNGIP